MKYFHGRRHIRASKSFFISRRKKAIRKLICLVFSLEKISEMAISAAEKLDFVSTARKMILHEHYKKVFSSN